MELDVHILKMSYTPEDIWSKCISSVEAAKLNAGFPVNIHVVDGIYGHLGASRKRGYDAGTAPYATHVDDDDWVDDDAFRCLAEHMQQGVRAITTGERLIYADRISENVKSKHHLAVFSRKVLDEVTYEAFKYFPDQYLLSKVAPVHIEQCVYNHRISMESGSRRARRNNSIEADRELAIIRRPDLALVENATAAELAAANDYLLGEDK